MLAGSRDVDIGEGRTLHARVNGSGPTVVLVSGAGREGVGRWTLIEKWVAKFATVVTYDRAGLGKSPRSATPPTAADMCRDLWRLLDALDVPRPMVLVGQSLGGLLVQLYACDHPQQVAGLVLLDPTPDEFLAGHGALPPDVQAKMRKAATENLLTFGHGEGQAWELERIFESSEQLWRAVVEERRLPDVDTVVMTSCKAFEVAGRMSGGRSMLQPHRRIVERFPHGRHVLAEHSTHLTLLTEEADLVATQIRSIVTR